MKKVAKKITAHSSGNSTSKKRVSLTTKKATENKKSTKKNKKKRSSGTLISKKLGTAQELALLLNNTEESFVLIDTDFRILIFNNEFKKLNKKFFGRTVNKGDNFLDYTHPDKKEIVELIYNKVFTGEMLESEIEIALAGQPAFIFSNRFKPAYDNRKNIIGATITTIDITELKRSQQLLLTCQQRLRDVTDELLAEQKLNKTREQQQQLTNANNLNQAVIETCPVGIWIFEESGQAITVNKAGLELGGTDAKDLLSLNFRELESWKKMGLYEAALEALESGRMIKKEIQGYNGTNPETWFEALLTVVQFNGKKQLILTAYDIKERMYAEAALKKSEMQTSVVTHLAKIGYWELNIEEGVFTFNEHFYNILRTTAEEMGGYTMQADLYGQRFLHPDDSGLVQEETRKAIETTDPDYSRSLEHRIIYPNGEIGYLAVRFFIVKDDQGRTIKIVGANQNITEQKMAAQQIQLSKERYEMVLRATNDAIYEWDIVEYVNYWGKGYETLFGHEWMEGKMDPIAWIGNLHPEEKDAVIAKTYEAFEKKEPSITRELRFRCADGTYKTVFDKAIILYNPHGAPVKIIGAMQDITGLKKNDIEIRELNERLNKRAEELAASNAELERFAYVASHDLQEPLRMVSSFLQLLQKKYTTQLDESAAQYIAFAVDGADRMKKLILDLLEYSRVGTNQDKLIKTDMNEVVKQVLEIFGTEINETGAVVNMQTLPVINVNRMQMTQLIQNLLANALKYTTSGITEIEIGCREKDNEWEFFIKDNGIGIDQKYFDKIFVIFQRLHNKNQYSGTGIGLTICKKIVDRHGGNIWVKSSLGAGSTFFFTIKKVIANNDDFDGSTDFTDR